MGALLVLLGILLFMVIIVLIDIINRKVVYPIRHKLTGKCKFEISHIPSYGDIPRKFGWYKSEQEAKEEYRGWGDIIKQVYPKK